MTLKKIILQHSRNNDDYIPDYHFDSLEQEIKKHILKIVKQTVSGELNNHPDPYKDKIIRRSLHNIVSKTNDKINERY